jgi:cobyrinic acid a,c-diamide synthase
MSEALARELFSRATRTADMALIEGCFDAATCSPESNGGSLDTLCQWLGLPRVVVFDARQSEQLPPRPTADAVLLDRVANQDDLRRWTRKIQEAWGLPVLGGMPELPQLRATVTQLPPGSLLPLPICAALGDALQRYIKLPELFRLSASATWPDVEPAHDWDSLRRQTKGRPATVAVAYDKAFHCHFLDTLDMLELLGATVIDFSPLQDEAIPEDADLVYLGCGRPDRYLSQLNENVCLRMDMQRHVCEGRRIYAEGGGLAYLAEELIGPAGRQPMLGLIPLCVRLSEDAQPLRAVELTLSDNSWMSDRQLSLKGYQNSNWHLEPTGSVSRLCSVDGNEHDLLVYKQVIGSRVYLNFAAEPQTLCSLLAPRKYTLA